MKNRELQNLRRLAAAHGIQLSYRTMDARRKQISGPTLAAVLKCLGVPAESSADVRDSLAAQAKAAWERCVPAAVVAWDGRPVRLQVHVLAGQEHKPAQCELRLESSPGFSLVKRTKKRIILGLHDPLRIQTLRQNACQSTFTDSDRAFHCDVTG